MLGERHLSIVSYDMPRRPAGIVAAWEIPALRKEDFSITYRLETYQEDGAPCVEEVVMSPTEEPRAPLVTAADRRAEGHYRLCHLTVKPTRLQNPPPIPNTRNHIAVFAIRYGSMLLHTYTLEWHAYGWTRMKKNLEGPETLVDLNRTARLTVVNRKYRPMDVAAVSDAEKINRYEHVPRMIIRGERGFDDWKPGQEKARDGLAVFTNQPRAYCIQALDIYIDAVCLHNTRKAEAHRKRMATVVEIEPIDRLRDQIPDTPRRKRKHQKRVRQTPKVT